MTTADDVRPGDRVRLTWTTHDDEGDPVLNTVIGIARSRPGYVSMVVSGRALQADQWSDDAHASVEVIERALPPEPPAEGTILASPGCTPFIRAGAGWFRYGYTTPFAWADVWTSDLVILRNGWEG